MGLERDIEEIRAAIKIGRFGNEAAISQGVVLRLLNALGWPAYDTQTVNPEYRLEGRRVDYALCHPPEKPIAFIEVKNIGQGDGAERQLFEYAFHKGVQLAILTDGREWDFFLPAERGDYAERRVYKLDIVERDLGECTLRLNRYLKYDAVLSGDAIEAAREDYRDVAREREMQSALPRAWAQLVEDEDEQLLEAVADRVESLCGYKPDSDTVASFLRDNVAALTPSSSAPASPPKTHVPPSAVASMPDGSQPKATGFVLDGKRYAARNASDVLIKVLEALTKRDPSFPERFAALPKHGRKRRYLARDRNDLYPGRPDLVHDHSKQLTSDWWVGTNHSRMTIRRIIEMACDVAHMRYGEDLRVELGE